MEKHFLDDLVEGEPGFKPGAWYNRFGDCIEFCLANEGIVAERIDEVITIYRSAVDKRAIGFQIKGVQAILKGLDASYMRIDYANSGDAIRHVKVGVALTAAIRISLQDRSAVRRLDKYAELLPVVPKTASEEEVSVPAGCSE